MFQRVTIDLSKRLLDAFNLLEFVDGKITRKDSFWKIVT